MTSDELLNSHRQELWRGAVVLASLLALQNSNYGYSLLEALAKAGVPVPANTIYPLLRRLEKQGLLTSDWDTSGVRPRKFYRTSRDGVLLAQTLLREWRAVDTALTDLSEVPTEPTEPAESTENPTE